MRSFRLIRVISYERATLYAAWLCWLYGCAPSPPVVVKAPEKPRLVAPEPDFSQKTTLKNIQFTIQVGAFSDGERALLHAAQLQSKDLDAYHFIDSDGLYKVRFGRFDTRSAALSRAKELKNQGLIQDFYIAYPKTANSSGPAMEILRDDLIQTARRFIGIPYRWGGQSAKSGFDCSGLTMTVYRLNGLDLPRKASSQFRAGTPVPRDEVKTGDLLFFATNGGNRVSHVGIYSGNGKFIHSPGRGKRIRQESMENRYFKERYVGARRYF